MTDSEIQARLTQEVERLLSEVERLTKEKRADVGIWIKAESNYQSRIKALEARVAELEKSNE